MAKSLNICSVCSVFGKNHSLCSPVFTGNMLQLDDRETLGFTIFGWMAEWLCSGLQSRGPRFDSGFSLQILTKTALF